ncbi:MAG: ABC transporter permease [Faecousia sp.]
MSVFHRVAVQSMRKNRTRTLVTIIGVILSAAMFTAVTTFAGTLMHHLQRSAAYQSGTYYFSLLDVDTATAEAVAKDKQTETLTAAQVLGYAKVASANENKPFLYVHGMDEGYTDLLPVHLLAGRLPENSTELVVPEHLDYDGEVTLALGETVTLEFGIRSYQGEPLWQNNMYFPYEPEDFTPTMMRTYTVVGISERADYEDYSAPGYLALTRADPTIETGVYDLYVRTTDYDTDTMNAFMDRYTFSAGSANWDYLMALGNYRYDNFTGFVTVFVCVLVFLILLGSVSMIYSAFSISVSERTKQFGLLSSIGATRKQLRATVLHEAAIVCLIGIPLGLLAGCGGMWITISLLGDKLTGMFGGASNGGLAMQYHVSAVSLIGAAVIAVLTVFLSAIIPARRAMKVTAIEAIRQSRDVSVKGRDVRSGKLTYKLFGLPGMLSKKYFRRSRKKYRATIFSLSMSVLLFVSAGTYGMYLTDSVEGVSGTTPYDLSYSSSAVSMDDYEKILPDLRQADGIKTAVASTLRVESTVFDAGQLAKSYVDFLNGASEPLQTEISIFYLDEASFDAVLSHCGLTRADYDANPGAIVCNRVFSHLYSTDGNERVTYQGAYLDENQTAVELLQSAPAENEVYEGSEYLDGAWVSHYRNYETGKQSIRPAKLQQQRVLAYTDEDLFGTNRDMICLYLPYSALEGEYAGELCCTVSDNDTAQASLAEVFAAHGVSYRRNRLYNALDEQRTANNMLTVVRVFSYGFITLISLICVANVFNTISTNIALRRRDFAMLRSVGMTRGGLNGMVCFECGLYGFRALLIGLPLSAALTYLLYRAAAGMYYNNDFHLSWSSVLIASLSVILVVFVSMMYAMRKVKKDNPIDALKEENT